MVSLIPVAHAGLTQDGMYNSGFGCVLVLALYFGLWIGTCFKRRYATYRQNVTGKLKNYPPNIFVIYEKLKLMIDSVQRDKLIDKIRQIEDPEILNEIQRFLEIEFDDKPFITNEEQKKAIQRAREQIKKGEIIDEEQANNQTDEWLNG